MRSTLAALCTLGLLLTTVAPARSDDDEAIKAILNKGIKELGGEDKLNKLQGLILKGKGTYIDGDKRTPFTATWHMQGSDKSRTVIVADLKGRAETVTRVLNGDNAWSKSAGDETKTLDKDDLAEEKENAHLNYLVNLAPLKTKNFTLALLEEITIDDKVPAVGLKVSSRGRRDVKLYFDKETGLPIRAERTIRIKDPKTKEYRDVAEVVSFADYKDADGIKVATKFVTKWDGKPQADAVITEITAKDKLDEKLFTKP